MKKMTIVAALFSAALMTSQAGELDPSQQKWFAQYEKQANVPKPEAMLLNDSPEPELRQGFVPLFNGTNLAGWTAHGGSSKFEVRDGCIVGECVKDVASTYLCTDRTNYTDFILTLEMKTEVEINSGVQFRSRLEGAKGETVAGPQMEMEPPSLGRNWSGGIYGQSCGGWFYPLWLKENAAARAALKADGWNRLTIQASGDTVRTWLNGVPVACWKSDTYRSGFFGLQIHKATKGRVLWRNLQVKAL